MNTILVHHRFEQHVVRAPAAPAVVFEGRSFTYQEVEYRANQLAHRLRALGVQPETKVGIYLDRSPDLVVALLGVFKAGGAYVPLDPRYPNERLAFLLADADVSVVLTEKALALSLPAHRARSVVLDSDLDEEEIARYEGEACADVVDAEHCAYVIYTSGSTGQPKGTLLTHGGLANLIAAQQEVFELGPGCRVLQFSPLVFDASLFEIVMALASGGTLYLARQSELLPGSGLISLLRRAAITHLTIPPSVLAAVPDEPLPALRHLVVAGEACAESVARRWGAGRRFFNAYGPTECTVWVTVAQHDGVETPAIGRPVRGFRAHVLGPDLTPVPRGQTGELGVSGAGLARGYLGRPDLTASRFVPDPWPEAPGERLYLTGDLVRQSLGGDLEFLGRLDDQVKVHGRRIEPGEIEAVLNGHPGVRESVVVVREAGAGRGTAGDRRLVAYVVRDPRADIEVAVAELRAWARRRLPEFMVPAAFVFLGSFPLTLNGKIDRKALPAPVNSRPELGVEFVAPRTPMEEQIVRRFSALLDIEPIGVDDDFFELGGHSLLATRLAGELASLFHVEVPLARVFSGLTAAGLARYVEEEAAGPSMPSPRPLPRDGRPLPLSFSQERVWFIQQMHPRIAAYHASSVLKLTGELDVRVLEGALGEVVRRHEILRTTFPEVDGEPRQEIHPSQPVRLSQVELSALEPARLAVERQRQIDCEVRRPFVLTRLPLVRWTLLRLARDEHWLVQVEHHLVHDGWSFNILLGELTKAYRSLKLGRRPDLPELAIQFADFAAWQREWMRGPEAQRQLAHWRQRLAGIEALELPWDRPRPPLQSFDGEVLPLPLPADLAAGLRAFSQREGATIFMVLLAAFAALLQRWSVQDDFAIGSGVANRHWPETHGLIGMIINNLVLRMSLPDTRRTSFRQLVQQVRQVTFEAYAHQDVPFDRIVDALELQRDPRRNPLFQVAFSFHDSPLEEVELPDLRLETEVALSSGSAKFDLSVVAILPREQRQGSERDRADEAISMLWEYNTDLFERTTLLRLLGAYRRTLDGVLADPDMLLPDLPLLGSGERHQLLVEWNDSAFDVPGEELVHELFVLQARRWPERLAIGSRVATWSYRELDRRANRLGRQLARLGIGPESRVGIFTLGSPEMVVGLLAVLKAGGAYVPIDPAYPAERIDFILKDAGIAALLTTSGQIGSLPELGIPLLLLDAALADACDEDDIGPAAGLLPAHLAYVIYTSGSTGRPKGVEVSHGALLNLVRWHQRTYRVEPADRATQIASPAFDASVWEIWPYLTAGASLHFPGEEIRAAPAELVRFFAEQRITLSFVPTPLAEAMLEESGQWPREWALRALLTGGDRLSRKAAGLALFNHYGPTENAVVATWCPVPADAPGPPPIGRPLDNVHVHVLDPHLDPVPLGSPGELCIGGSSLSRGYLGRADLIAERFVPDPFSGVAGERLYRTGDRVRYLPGGEVDFLGRLDRQVKVRGFRIELGEVEAALCQHPLVRDAVVVAASGKLPQLWAYVVADDGREELSELESFLRGKLPSYMIPSAFVVLPQLPLNAHGKVNRQALPAPRACEGTVVAPSSPTERGLAEIWAAVLGLGVEWIGAMTTFFDLGGNSLLATRVVSRIRQAFKLEVPLQYFLQAPTIATLAGWIDGMENARSDAAPQLEIGRLGWRDAEAILGRLDELSDAEVVALLDDLEKG